MMMIAIVIIVIVIIIITLANISKNTVVTKGLTHSSLVYVSHNI